MQIPFVLRGNRKQAGFTDPTNRHLIVYAEKEEEALRKAIAWKLPGEQFSVAGRCYF
jgi:hypothetical protein